MRKYLITIVGLLVMLSCDQKSKSSSADDADNETEQIQERLKTQNLTYSYEQDKVEVSIDIDYPKSNDLLGKAIAEFISEKLGGTYEEDLSKGQEVIDYYGDKLKAELKENRKNDLEDGMEEDYINGYSNDFSIKKIYETDRLVTFLLEHSIYLNGAHGVDYVYGQTFRKSDGRRFDAEMMRNLDHSDMYQIRKEGIREYFQGADIDADPGTENEQKYIDDEELKEYIITEDNINFMPMPRHAPYVTKKGITFSYQPYEISFYAAGAPEFTVPLKKMKPFLTQTARNLLEL